MNLPSLLGASLAVLFSVGGAACGTGDEDIFGTYRALLVTCDATSDEIQNASAVEGSLIIHRDRSAVISRYSACRRWCISEVVEATAGVLKTTNPVSGSEGDCSGAATFSSQYCPLDGTYTQNGDLVRYTAAGRACTPLRRTSPQMGSECIVHGECDDSDPCTLDQCLAGLCDNRPRPTCE